MGACRLCYKLRMVRIGTWGIALIAACIVAAACSSSTTPGSADDAGGGVSDAARGETDAATPADASDAAIPPDAGTYVFSFSLTLAGKKVTFDRGQFGTDTGALYLELYDGGDPACPSQNSPTPKHTLIVSGLEKSGASSPKVTLLDFVGDVITTPKPSRAASAATATMHASADNHIELDLTATFDADGSGVGQIVADHCTSLDAK